MSLTDFLVKKHLEAACPKRTCILVVQPWTLRQKDPSLCKKLLSCIRKLKERGVLVGYVSYADAVLDPFVRSSDFAFFMMSSNLAQGRGISKEKAKEISSNFQFIPQNYPLFIPVLDKELEKRKIDTLLIVGGFREDCVLAVAKYTCKLSRIPKLKIRLIEKLLVSQRRLFTNLDMPGKLAHYQESSSCNISLSKKDPELIYLKYFS